MFQRRSLPRLLLIPALLTTIAYVDPGNFGTNITAGQEHGYALVWVVVAASIAAALVQYLAAKLGAVTGQSLAEHWAGRLGRRARVAAWLQAQAVVVMTDLAEIVGGALGLRLLFGIPLPIGAIIIGAVSFVCLGIRWRGHSAFRPVALALLVLIGGALLAVAARLQPDPAAVLGGLRPQPLGGDALLAAVGIVGATVMPHALYFHSAMCGEQPQRRPRLLARPLVLCIGAAMAVATLVNLALLVIGATTGRPAVGSGDGIDSAHAAILEAAGQFAAVGFGVALVASGLASTLVGAWTGQAVMSGFLEVRLAAWKRRLLALAPPVAVLALGVDPTRALFLSQVALSFALPATLGALVWFSSKRSVMGDQRCATPVLVLAWAITGAITVMDLAVLVPLVLP